VAFPDVLLACAGLPFRCSASPHLLPSLRSRITPSRELPRGPTRASSLTGPRAVALLNLSETNLPCQDPFFPRQSPVLLSLSFPAVTPGIVPPFHHRAPQVDYSSRPHGDSMSLYFLFTSLVYFFRRRFPLSGPLRHFFCRHVGTALSRYPVLFLVSRSRASLSPPCISRTL